MKKIKLALLKYFSKKIEIKVKELEGHQVEVIEPADEIQYAYHSLSPLGDADPEGAYAQALKWALKNRKSEDIKNIAVTGTYGSGKSTILKTFQKHNKDKDLSFLNISLATFKEETDLKNTPDGSDLLRLIELSILQQIFYREEDEKIPDSRFKKIKSLDNKRLQKLSVSLFLLVLATVQLFNKKFLEDIFGYEFYELSNIIVTIVCLLIVIPGYFFLILKSIRAISSITISKLNISNAEIEISDTISKSILNNHLDEILYFFEVTDYTVVIIEDLDRFEQTEIFTKLRELNLLINSSKKIGRDIAFIYAVRDDMFKDKDRTKFFDFIIPVIPVINSSNSNEKLMEIVTKNKYGIKSDLIENISLFIDDMRLLYNITNEYHIYHEKLGKLNEDRLLSMIVYKNIYPNDFVKLSKLEGDLYTAFTKKESFIKEKIANIDIEISSYKDEIADLQKLKIKDVRELRMLYVAKYLEILTNVVKFRINGVEYTFSEVTTDELFPAFVDNSVLYDHTTHNYSNNYILTTSARMPIKFEKIETFVDPDRSYQERLDLVNRWTSDQIEASKVKIAELESKKNEIRNYKVKDVILMGGYKLEVEDKKQLQLVNILLRNGYIDEDYLDYISIFYEGSITKADREFLLNVKAQISTVFEYQLHKIDKLIPKIDTVDFTQSYILNYALVDYLFSKTHFKKQKTEILKLLSSESDTAIAFLKGFIDASKGIGVFVKELAKAWPRIWQYFSKQSDLPKEKLEDLLKLIAEHVAAEDIKAIAHKSKLAFDIASMPDFLNSGIDPGKIKELIKTLNIKFADLNFEAAPDELAKFVYQGHYYILSTEMIENVIKANGTFQEDDFKTRNFYAINESGCQHLIDYVEDEIEAYVSDVYLEIETNTDEDETYLLSLLNNDSLSLESKEAIIMQAETKILSIETVEDEEVIPILFDESGVTPTWKNILHYYHHLEDEFNPHIVSFLSDKSNAEVLSKSRVDINNPIPDLETVQKFLRTMILSAEIPDESYQLILNSVPYNYPNLDFTNLPDSKASMLIKQGTVGMTVVNYDRIREHFPNLISFQLDHWHSKFIEDLEKFEIGKDQIHSIVVSNSFTVGEKNKVLAHTEAIIIAADDDNLFAAIGKLRVEDTGLEVGKEILLKSLFSANLNAGLSLKLLNKIFDSLNKNEITDVLQVLAEPYSEITVLGRRPKLPDTQDNWELARKLIRSGYIKRATDERGSIRISTFRQ
ncbi:hypothetical protein ABDJ41_18565 [Pedobacter sp. ASV1-7]|uniref:YobI family P-loop NTPase n=1 Tax=Pedobacter sp. ASV1-7 TaxID=3145237 RepID=UPI0032E87A07